MEKSRIQKIKEQILTPRVSQQELDNVLKSTAERRPIPVLWLIGKTQSGKTSIVRALTGSSDAEVGNGFQPCTSTAGLYDFPAELPLVRFLDTRGIGEVAYDPEEDIRYCESKSQLIIAVLRAADPNQKSIFEVLRAVRKQHPDWPVVIVQTALHQCHSPGWEHPEPYPYRNLESLPPDDLVRSLSSQRERLDQLPGDAGIWWVPIDFTLPEDGFSNPVYGLEELWQTIEEATSFNLSSWLEGDRTVKSTFEQAAHPHIVSYSLAAAGMGAFPLVDIAGVPAVQLKLFHALASIYHQKWTKKNSIEFLGFFGAGAALSFGLQYAGRSALKLIPGWGQTAGAVIGAASSGAITYALGKSACYYLGRKRKGLNIDGDVLRSVFSEQLALGREALSLRRKTYSQEHPA